MLAPDRLTRFARHIVLPEVGGAGQVALCAAHVVLVGCGGIGSPALQYLAAAGIGERTAIADGATPGQKVVIDGIDRLKDGAPIKLADAKPADGTAKPSGERGKKKWSGQKPAT